MYFTIYYLLFKFFNLLFTIYYLLYNLLFTVINSCVPRVFVILSVRLHHKVCLLMFLLGINITRIYFFLQ